MRLLANGDEAEASARAAVGEAAEVIPAKYGDIWLRDTGPIFARDDESAVALRFKTNSWGGKYDLPDDATVGDDIARLAATPVRRFDFVLEGGAVDHDGEGTILTTRQTLSNPNRNGWTKAAAEQALADAFGARKIIWIDEGLKNDHTDGHIDNIARFVAPGRVVCQAPAGPEDPNAETLDAIARDARSCNRCERPQARRRSHPGRRPLSQRARRSLAGLAYELHYRERRRRRAGLRNRRRRRRRSKPCSRYSRPAKSLACRLAVCSAAAAPVAARSTASLSRSRPNVEALDDGRSASRRLTATT